MGVAHQANSLSQASPLVQLAAEPRRAQLQPPRGKPSWSAMCAQLRASAHVENSYHEAHCSLATRSLCSEYPKRIQRAGPTQRHPQCCIALIYEPLELLVCLFPLQLLEKLSCPRLWPPLAKSFNQGQHKHLFLAQNHDSGGS
jgi:hypothetical protein